MQWVRVRTVVQAAQTDIQQHLHHCWVSLAIETLADKGLE